MENNLLLIDVTEAENLKECNIKLSFMYFQKFFPSDGNRVSLSSLVPHLLWSFISTYFSSRIKSIMLQDIEQIKSIEANDISYNGCNSHQTFSSSASDHLNVAVKFCLCLFLTCF